MGAAGLALVGATAQAEQGKGGKGSDQPKQHQQQQQKGGGGGGGPGTAKHQHKHANGHAMLGAKLKQDGKHAVGKLKDKTVTAEVKGGKVVGMDAGGLPMKRVKTKQKMAAFDDGGIIRAAFVPGVQLAQYEEYYYGYCFDDGYDYECYWYPAEDVDYQDYTWEDYDPYY